MNTCRKLGLLSTIAAFGALQSCTVTRIAHQIEQTYVASTPADDEHSITLPRASFDEAWESIISFFAEKQISIETVEKESGIVVAKKMLTSGSDGEGIAALGAIASKRSLLKQWLKPSQFAGSANPGVVRSTGTVTREEVMADSMLESTKPATYRLAISFNVFVARFSESELRVTVNVSMTAADSLRLYRGWTWRAEFPSDRPRSEAEIIAGLVSAGVSPIIVDAKPVSTGSLEQALLDYVRQRVSKNE